MPLWSSPTPFRYPVRGRSTDWSRVAIFIFLNASLGSSSIVSKSWKELVLQIRLLYTWSDRGVSVERVGADG